MTPEDNPSTSPYMLPVSGKQRLDKMPILGRIAPRIYLRPSAFQHRYKTRYLWIGHTSRITTFRRSSSVPIATRIPSERLIRIILRDDRKTRFKLLRGVYRISRRSFFLPPAWDVIASLSNIPAYVPVDFLARRISNKERTGLKLAALEDNAGTFEYVGG